MTERFSIFGIAATTLCAIIAIALIFNALGYRVIDNMYDAEKRGEELVATAGQAKDCFKIKTFFPTYPPLGQFQSGCIRRHAELAHDPLTCKLLLPSEYGIHCINSIISEEYREFPDSGFFDYAECKNDFEDTLKQDWCYFLEAHQNKSVDNCNSIANKVVKEGCMLKFQTWNQYPELRNSSYFGE